MTGAGTAPLSRLDAPRWRALAQARRAPVSPAPETCEMCREPMPLAERHRHVLDRDTGDLACACPPCSVLFDRDEAGGGRYRLVPQRRLPVDDLNLDDAQWQGLGFPVGLAFFVRDSARGCVIARYPSAAGPTEAEVDGGSWARLCERAPMLDSLTSDVEALLVNRVRGRREHWIAPLDDCYRLVAILRTTWEGFTGGDAAWDAIDGFFASLAGATTEAPAHLHPHPSARR